MISTEMAAAALVAFAAGGVAFVFIYPLLSGEARAEKRQKALVGAKRESRAERAVGANRRDQVAQSLKDLEAREKARNSATLEQRIAQAGLTWSRNRFFVISAVMGLAFAGLIFLASGNLLLTGGALFAGGFGLPRWVLGFLKNRRINRFLDELPNAMDVIVRGIRAGLPLNDCVRIVAGESKEPVRGEFRQVIEAQAMGISIPDAVTKMYERVPVAEANFFGIVLGIQAKSGGNLSEALGNLSKVLRDRKKMKGKIKAMSAEAKASASIIASLPFAVALLVYLSSPGYISQLWTTSSGQVVMFASGVWMTIGVLVMKKMISFDI